MSQKSIYSQFETLPGDNLFLDFAEIQFPSVVKTLETIANELDEYHGLYALLPQVQLVIGGLKPVAKIHVDRALLETYKTSGLAEGFDSIDFAKVLFENAGIRLDEYGFSLDSKTIDFYAYNPEHVKLVQEHFFPGEKYHGQNLNTYIKHVLQKGINQSRLFGYLTGKPSTAIAQYETNYTDKHCRFIGKKVVAGYGESYMIWGEPMPRDVSLREEIKQHFFTSLSLSSRYNGVMDLLDQRASVFRYLSLTSSLEQLTTKTR